MMITLAMVVMLIVAGVLYYLSYNYSEEKNIIRLTDLGYSLQNELILASQVEPGYERTIIIPAKVGTAGYSISQTENDLVIRYREIDLTFQIPQVSGTLAKGSNTIRKTDANTITIN